MRPLRREEIFPPPALPPGYQAPPEDASVAHRRLAIRTFASSQVYATCWPCTIRSHAGWGSGVVGLLADPARHARL
jgi:hypothetical protein